MSPPPELLFFQTEPEPVTKAVLLLEVEDPPRTPPLPAIIPPLLIVSRLNEPVSPRMKLPLLLQSEPGPVTMA